MTSVCYDGELLAADRKSRVRDKNGDKKVKSLTKEKILTDFEGCVFDGDRVLAVGRAGVLKVSKELIATLRCSQDLMSTIDNLGDELRNKFAETEMRAASLLIMTARHIYTVRVTKAFAVTCKKDHRSKKVAIGSGRVTALFLMEHCGLSATDAVASMELHSEGCGGGVTFTSRILSGQKKSLHVIIPHDKRTLARNFLTSVIVSAKKKLVLLPVH